MEIGHCTWNPGMTAKIVAEAIYPCSSLPVSAEELGRRTRLRDRPGYWVSLIGEPICGSRSSLSQKSQASVRIQLQACSIVQHGGRGSLLLYVQISINNN